jgi:hypothetical protein
MGLATKSNPTPFGSNLGLVSMPNLIAMDLTDKPDPTAFGTQNRKDNAPINMFLLKKQQRQHLHDATVSSTVQTLLYNIKKSHLFIFSLPYEKKREKKKILKGKKLVLGPSSSKTNAIRSR